MVVIWWSMIVAGLLGGEAVGGGSVQAHLELAVAVAVAGDVHGLASLGT